MPANAPRPPLQLLDDPSADPGSLADALFEGTPEHLLGHLQLWLGDYFGSQPGLAERVAVRLRFVSNNAWSSIADELTGKRGMQLLEVVNAALQLDDKLSGEILSECYVEDPAQAAIVDEYGIPAWLGDGYGWTPNSTSGPMVDRLEQLLEDSGSAYTVDWKPPVRLTRRVDPTVVAAAREAMAADPTAGELLAEAWRRVYGLESEHDPDGAYSRAIRAVEQIVCPLVLHAQAAASKATLGSVIGELAGSQASSWTFALTDKDDTDDIAPVVDSMRRLWQGQKSRHGGGSNSRPQTIEEARAAVHTAAFLVQMFASKAVARRTP